MVIISITNTARLTGEVRVGARLLHATPTVPALSGL